MGWNLIDDHPKVKIGSSQGAAIKIDQNLYVAILAMMRFICSSSIFISHVYMADGYLFFLNYSKASRYTASSCTDLDNARF